MKVAPILFLYFIFLGILYGHLSSDPESITVQSPKDNDQNNSNTQAANGEQSGFVSKEGNSVYRRYWRPHLVNNRTVWRENTREPVIRIQNVTVPKVWRNFNLTTSRTITEKGIPSGKGEVTIADTKSSILVGPSNPRTIIEKSVLYFNSEISIDDDESQIPTNSEGNNNNNDRDSNSSSFTTKSQEEYSKDENPENVVTKSAGKIPPDSNFFAGIVNDFAFKLVEVLNLESNFVISPLSIFVALSMCYLGADGHTKAQMEQALGLNDNAVHGKLFHQGIKDLLVLVLKETRYYKLFAANGMFLGQNFAIDAHFEEEIKMYYDAELGKVDFGNPQLSQRFINTWLDRTTNGTIRKITDSPPSSLTRLILLNAVYFEGYWKTSFPSSMTCPGNFHSIGGNEKRVRFMNVLDKIFPVFRSDEHKHTFIKLPYEGDHLSMIIALPFSKEEKPMPSVTNEILHHMRHAMIDTKLGIVSIPKYRLEYKNSLIKALETLGIKDIFDKNLADLRKLRKENDVYVSAFIHKAVVRVHEADTTEFRSTSAWFNPFYGTMKNTNFVADHPFAFYIVHEASGLVLFHGKVFGFYTMLRGK